MKTSFSFIIFAATLLLQMNTSLGNNSEDYSKRAISFSKSKDKNDNQETKWLDSCLLNCTKLVNEHMDKQRRDENGEENRRRAQTSSNQSGQEGERSESGYWQGFQRGYEKATEDTLYVDKEAPLAHKNENGNSRGRGIYVKNGWAKGSGTSFAKNDEGNSFVNEEVAFKSGRDVAIADTNERGSRRSTYRNPDWQRNIPRNGESNGASIKTNDGSLIKDVRGAVLPKADDRGNNNMGYVPNNFDYDRSNVEQKYKTDFSRHEPVINSGVGIRIADTYGGSKTDDNFRQERTGAGQGGNAGVYEGRGIGIGYVKAGEKTGSGIAATGLGVGHGTFSGKGVVIGGGYADVRTDIEDNGTHDASGTGRQRGNVGSSAMAYGEGSGTASGKNIVIGGAYGSAENGGQRGTAYGVGISVKDGKASGYGSGYARGDAFRGHTK